MLEGARKGCIQALLMIYWLLVRTTIICMALTLGNILLMSIDAIIERVMTKCYILL